MKQLKHFMLIVQAWIKKMQARFIKVERCEAQFLKAAAKNPYLQSKLLWNDMYGDIQTKLQNSYRIIFLLCALLGISIVGFIVIAGQTKVKPVPFIIRGQEVITLNPEQRVGLDSVKSRLASYFVSDFIRASRSVSADRQVNQQHRIAAYSFVGGSATEILNTFYERSNPDVIAKSSVKSVKITSILPKGPNGFDIRWQETWRNVDTGAVEKSARYIAEVVVGYENPSENEVVLRYNPMGFVIKELSWAKDNEGVQ